MGADEVCGMEKRDTAEVFVGKHVMGGFSGDANTCVRVGGGRGGVRGKGANPRG